MKPVLTPEKMRLIDEGTINNHNIPGLVLMERAALSVVDEIEKDFSKDAFAVALIGTGNNGGDGVAIIRMLYIKGYKVGIILTGDREKYSESLERELKILESYVKLSEITVKKEDIKKADFVIDALFGIGLKREILGEFKGLIDFTNECNKPVYAVDIPSGICAGSGRTLGTSIKAFKTVTFNYKKTGHCLLDGYIKSGEVIVKDVGIYLDEKDAVNTLEPEDTDLADLKERALYANKGSGKVLIIGGSEEIYGALFLSTVASYKTGAGYVKVYTHKNNSVILKEKVPEVVCTSYENVELSKVKELLNWADSVVLGPGLSTSEEAKKLVKFVLEENEKPLVIDADAINIIAGDVSILNNKKCQAVITPHMLEMSRLSGLSMDEIKLDMIKASGDFSEKYGVAVVLKNFVTVTAVNGKVFLNTNGCEKLATAGSGDVLSGIIGGLLAMGNDLEKAASLGVYIHAMAGNATEDKYPLAGDIARAVEL